MTLTPFGYDPACASAMQRATLALLAAATAAPSREAALLARCDAATALLRVALNELARAGAAGDDRAALAADDVYAALTALSRVRPRYDQGMYQ